MIKANGKTVWTTVASGLLVIIIAGSGAKLISHGERIVAIETKIDGMANDARQIKEAANFLTAWVRSQPQG